MTALERRELRATQVAFDAKHRQTATPEVLILARGQCFAEDKSSRKINMALFPPCMQASLSSTNDSLAHDRQWLGDGSDLVALSTGGQACILKQAIPAKTTPSRASVSQSCLKRWRDLSSTGDAHCGMLARNGNVALWVVVLAWELYAWFTVRISV